MDAADCQGIDKEFFPCNMEPCDMQVMKTCTFRKISSFTRLYSNKFILTYSLFSGRHGHHAVQTVGEE